MNDRNFKFSKHALALYDYAVERLETESMTAEDCQFLEGLAALCGLAYGVDTLNVNSPATCFETVRPGPRCPSPGSELFFMRRMVAKAGE